MQSHPKEVMEGIGTGMSSCIRTKCELHLKVNKAQDQIIDSVLFPVSHGPEGSYM